MPRDGRSRHQLDWLVEHRAQILTSIAVIAITAGGLLHLMGEGAAGQMVWRAAVALLATELAFEVARSIIVDHSLGVDTIALVVMVTALVQRAPKVAQLRIDDRLQEVPVEQVQIGDVVVVRTGEVIPVDGTLTSPEAVVDTSTLSGEPLPVTVTRGMPVLSGAANAGAPFDVRASRPASDSAYSAVVRLV